MKFIKFVLLSLIFSLNNIYAADDSDYFVMQDVRKEKLEDLEQQLQEKNKLLKEKKLELIKTSRENFSYSNLYSKLKELQNKTYNLTQQINDLRCCKSYFDYTKQDKILIENATSTKWSIHALIIKLGMTKTNNYEQHEKNQIKLDLLNKIYYSINLTKSSLYKLVVTFTYLNNIVDDIYQKKYTVDEYMKKSNNANS